MNLIPARQAAEEQSFGSLYTFGAQWSSLTGAFQPLDSDPPHVDLDLLALRPRKDLYDFDVVIAADPTRFRGRRL